MNIEKINEEIKILEKQKAFLKRISFIETNDINLNIYIKYIQMENIADVAKEINEMGYRIETKRSNRKYTSSDISEIIKAKKLINDAEIDSTAKDLFYDNKKKVSKYI